MSRVIIAKGKDIRKRTLLALKKLSPKLPPKGSKILIKPNLVEPMPKESGAITRAEVIEGIIQFLGDKNYEIIVGEGSAIYETERCFEEAGYYEILSKYRVRIVNLNRDEFTRVRLDGKIWKEVEVSKLALESYLVSAAVLKEHAFEVTLSLKNLMGILKPKGKYPVKSYIHEEDDYRIWAERMCDLLSKIKPKLAIIDGTTGMFGSHLYGMLKRFDLTIVSEDGLAADLVGAKILGHENVYYLKLGLERKVGNYPREVLRVNVQT